MERGTWSVGRGEGGRWARRAVVRRWLVGGAVLAAAPVLVACGGQAAGASGQPTAKATGGPVVEMNDRNQFVPASLTVTKGTTVTWKNVGLTVHNIVTDPAMALDKRHAGVPAGAKTVASPMVGAGGAWSFTFEVVGEYRYLCQPHETLGMVGTITVTE